MYKGILIDKTIVLLYGADSIPLVTKLPQSIANIWLAQIKKCAHIPFEQFCLNNSDHHWTV